MTLHHWTGQRRVGGVSLQDHTVGYHAALAPAQTYLVAELGLPTLLHNDIGVCLENGNDLLIDGDVFPIQHSTLTLVQHNVGQVDEVTELIAEILGMGPIRDTQALSVPQIPHGCNGRVYRLLCYFYKLLVKLLLLLRLDCTDIEGGLLRCVFGHGSKA